MTFYTNGFYIKETLHPIGNAISVDVYQKRDVIRPWDEGLLRGFSWAAGVAVEENRAGGT